MSSKKVKKIGVKGGEKPRDKNNAYLTKRILQSAARRGVIQAATETMSIVGYNVIAQNGWVVKKFNDGRIEKISRIHPIKRTGAIRLD